MAVVESSSAPPSPPTGPPPPSPSTSPERSQKYRSIKDIMKIAKFAVVERDDYSDVTCSECGSGDDDSQLLLCDKCDKAYHMLCVRPIVVRVPIGSWFCPGCSDHSLRVKSFTQTKILDFFRIKKCTASSVKRISPQDCRRRRRRTGTLVYQKRRRRLLPFTPCEDKGRRLEQMRSLACALTSLGLEFSNQLTYSSDMAPRCANQAMFEDGGMQVFTDSCFTFQSVYKCVDSLYNFQVLSKEDTETFKCCSTMIKRGECPPLLVVFDSREGYTVEADAPIKDLTFIAEYTGDVDYLKNRERDDCDSLMTLLLATDPSKSLVICPDKRANISRFINGINNYTPEGKKKQNVKCVRYNVNGESRVLLVATRDIGKGERLYYDYNGYEHEYPTHHFV